MTSPMSSEQYRAMMASGEKRNKLGNVPTVVDGIRFHSAKESRVWSQLVLREKAGEITDLDRQVKHLLEGRDGPILTEKGNQYAYIADFRYFDREIGRYIVEDVKGHATDLSLIKIGIMGAMSLPVRVVR